MEMSRGAQKVGKDFSNRLFVTDGTGGLADFELSVGKVSFEDAKFGAAFTEEFTEFIGGGTAIFGIEDGAGEVVVDEAGGGQLFEKQLGVAFVEVAAAIFEEGMGGAFGGKGEAGAQLHSVCTECKGGVVAGAGRNSTGCDEWKCGHQAHLWDKAKGGCFFAAVVATGFEAFGDEDVDTCFFAFAGKEGVGDNVGHDDAVFVQVRRPCFGAAGGGEDDGDMLIDNELHDFIDLRVHQRNVDAEGLGSG